MSRTFTRLLLALTALAGVVAPIAAQTKVNPATQINWPLITGAGTPTALGFGCTGVNYGQPFQNTAVTPNTYYTCGTDGWAIRGGSSSGSITIGTTPVALGGTIINAPGFNAATATALAAAGSDCPTGQYANGVDASGNALCVALPAQPGSQYVGPQALSGCGVEYVSGLTYTVGACSYSINHVTYNSPLTSITLPAADPTNPRIDVIFVDASQTVQSLQGTPAVTPQQPTVDPSTQLALTFVLIPAASTTPGNTTRVDIYLEGVEWTPAKGGTSAANVNLTSTNNPYQGTHDVEFGAGGTVVTTTFAGFTDPSAGTVDMANYNNLVFYIRNKAAWTITSSVTVQWYNGVTAMGTAVVISGGAFGFNATSNNTTYQQISIPTNTFGIAGIPVTSVRLTVSGTGTNLVGFYMDDMTLQGGVGGVVPPSNLMHFFGTWSSTFAYKPYDTVVLGGVGYVALAANTNVAVTTTSTWDALGAAGGNTTSTGGTVNTLPKFSGANAIVNSLFSDNGTIAAYTGAGGVLATSFSTNGTVNGFLNLTAQASTPTAPGTGTVQLTVPNTVTTPYAIEYPPNPPPDGTHTYFTCTFANPSVCNWSTGGSGSSFITSLTTSGTSGPSTVTSGVLNVPVYPVGAAYSTTLVDVFGGDSLGVVATVNTDAATSPSCNGTTCSFTATTPSFYTVGQWINLVGNVGGDPLWSPSCLNFSIVKVTAKVGGTISFSEAQSITPNETGCTGSVSGTGGLVQDASYFYPQQVTQQPYLTQGGTATPAVYNRAWPGDSLAGADTNFAAKYGDLAPNTTGNPANFFYFSDDICNNGSSSPFTPSQFETHLTSIMTQAHADGFNVILMTIPEGPPFSCGIGGNGNGDATFWAVNNWTRAQQCGETQARTGCADQVVDTWTYAVNAGTGGNPNTLLVQTSGPFLGHLTNAGGTVMANAVNIAMIAKNAFNSGGLAGLGANQYTGNQQMYGGFALQLTSWSSNTLPGSLQDFINGIGVYRAGYNYWQYLQKASECWAENDGGTGADYQDSPAACINMAYQGGSTYSHTLALGSGTFPSNTTQPTPGDATGSWYFTDWYLHGVAGDPSCALITGDSVIQYNKSTGHIRGCDNGSVVTLGGGGATFPSSPSAGFLYYTSPTVGRSSTANDLATLTYVADSGAANAYVATLAFPITSYTAGLTVTINPASSNTTTNPTLAVSGLTATVITKNGGAALVTNDIVSGTFATFRYDGTHFQLQNPQTLPATGVTAGSYTNINATFGADGRATSVSNGTSGGANPGASVFNITNPTTDVVTTPVSLLGGAQTIPSGYLLTSTPININMGGIFSVPTAYTGTVTVAVFVDGSQIATTGALTIPSTAVTNGSWTAQCQLTTYTTGVSGTYSFGCPFMLLPSSTATITLNGGSLAVSGTTAIDTTVSHTFDLKWTWSTATGSPTVTGQWGTGLVGGAPVVSVYGLTGAVSPTAHNVAAALKCADTSGSGTVQVCSTTPSYTPAAGDWIIYTTTTANTGTGLTINVNSLGAKSVAKWQGTTTLAANDILASKYVLMTYDGTNWEASTIGNAPSGSGNYVNLCSSVTLTNATCSNGVISITASAATVTIGSIPAHLSLHMEGQGVKSSATGGAACQLSGDSTSDYAWFQNLLTSTNAPLNSNSGGATSSVNCAAGGSVGAGFTFDVPGYTSTVAKQVFFSQSIWGSSLSLTGSYGITGQGVWNNASALTSITITAPSSGTFTSGNLFLWAKD